MKKRKNRCGGFKQSGVGNNKRGGVYKNRQKGRDRETEREKERGEREKSLIEFSWEWTESLAVEHISYIEHSTIGIRILFVISY